MRLFTFMLISLVSAADMYTNGRLVYSSPCAKNAHTEKASPLIDHRLPAKVQGAARRLAYDVTRA